MSFDIAYTANPDCQACGLYCHKKPLIELPRTEQVVCVGLAPKLQFLKDEIPLDPRTITGAIISAIEKEVGVSFFRTNLVKCVPIDDSDMLRYPTTKEIAHCIPHLKGEIASVNPKVELLLGEKVTEGVAKERSMILPSINGYQYQAIEHHGIQYIPVHHPSYIHIYRHDEVEQYISAVAQLVKQTITDAE